MPLTKWHPQILPEKIPKLMIKMITFAKFDKFEKPSSDSPNQDEKNNEDFTSLLSGLIPAPINNPLPSKAENCGENSSAEQTSEIPSEISAQTENLPQLPDPQPTQNNENQLLIETDLLDKTAETPFELNQEMFPDSLNFKSENSPEVKPDDQKIFRDERFPTLEIAPNGEFLSPLKPQKKSNFGNFTFDQVAETTKEFHILSDSLGENTFKFEEFQTPIEKSAPKLPPLLREVSNFLNTESNFSLAKQALQEMVQTDSPQKAADLPQQIESRLLELAASVKNGETQILRFRLNPAELGMVEVLMEKNELGKIAVSFQTESEAAREALLENLEPLRDSLQDAGWQVEKLEVSADLLSFGNNQDRENRSRQSETFETNLVFNAESEEKGEIEPKNLHRLVSLRA